MLRYRMIPDLDSMSFPCLNETLAQTTISSARSFDDFQFSQVSLSLMLPWSNSTITFTIIFFAEREKKSQRNSKNLFMANKSLLMILQYHASWHVLKIF